MVAKGTTIFQAARQVSQHSALCHEAENLGVENRPGACRICVVEVEGRRNLAPSCSTDCTEGMVVKTTSPRVLNARRTVMELILSDHPQDCLVCPSNGKCELQDLAATLGIREIRTVENAEVSTYRKDYSFSLQRDMDKCILCRRCESMCNDVQSVGALGAINRGFTSMVAPAVEQNLSESPCVFCGPCVAVCPTGALTRTYRKSVQGAR